LPNIWLENTESDALTANDFVILDRYTPANLAFQGALVSENEKKELWDWINAVERHLPKADVMVFLDVPRIHTQTLIQTRSNKNPLTDKDIHESDAEFEERVRQNYVDLAKQKNWVSIDCVSANRLLSPDEIHVLVIKSLRQRDIL
jgi:thymidylate kinase